MSNEQALRRSVAAFFVGALGALAGGLGWSGAAAALDKVTWQYAWLPTGEYAPFVAGDALGFYKEEGIELTMTRGFGSGDTVNKVAAGAVMIGDGDVSAVMAARLRGGAKVKSIMAGYTVAPHAIFVLESSGITDFKGLEGKTVGTTPGNSHQVYFPLVARAAGVDADKVKFLNVEPAAMGALLIQGRLDAAPFWSAHHYYLNKQAVKMGKSIRVLPFSAVGFELYSWCIFAQDDVIANKGELLQRFLRASKRSLDWAYKNDAEAVKHHVQRHPEVDADDALGSLRIMYTYINNDTTKVDGFGQFNAQRLAKTYKMVADAQGLDPSADPAQFVDTRYVPR